MKKSRKTCSHLVISITIVVIISWNVFYFYFTRIKKIFFIFLTMKSFALDVLCITGVLATSPRNFWLFKFRLLAQKWLMVVCSIWWHFWLGEIFLYFYLLGLSFYISVFLSILYPPPHPPKKNHVSFILIFFYFLFNLYYTLFILILIPPQLFFSLSKKVFCTYTPSFFIWTWLPSSSYL